MESTFAIIAEPNRRAILSLLAGAGARSVGSLSSATDVAASVSNTCGCCAMPASSRLASKRSVGFIACGPSRCGKMDEWLAPFRRFWMERVDALEAHLDRMAKAREENADE